MKPNPESNCTAFAGLKRIAQGSVAEVAIAVKKFTAKDQKATILVFDNETSAQLELDLRGDNNAIERRYQVQVGKGDEIGPGRPKLGVVAREITLLPRHWDWLSLQTGGASATLRKLVEDAKKKASAKDRIRQIQNVTYKFMLPMAGNLPDYENALRHLYSGDEDAFKGLIESWPKDIRDHVLELAKDAWND